MHRERLENVVRVLRSLPPEADFNLISWVGDLSREGEDWDSEYNSPAFHEADLPLIAQPMLIPHACGASACACGYAGLDPWFREQGFRTTPQGTVTFNGLQSWNAVWEFFELRESEANYLFSMGGSTVSPEEVADRIEAFLKTGTHYYEDDDE